MILAGFMSGSHKQNDSSVIINVGYITNIQAAIGQLLKLTRFIGSVRTTANYRSGSQAYQNAPPSGRHALKNTDFHHESGILDRSIPGPHKMIGNSWEKARKEESYPRGFPVSE
jgi:hypothetical protein